MKRKTGYWRMMTGLAMALACGPGVGRADVLLGVNGERFVGQVIEEQADIVVFQSELGGRLTVPRNRIREIQHTPPAAAPSRPPLALAAPATNAPALL